MENNIHRKSKIRWSIQPSSGGKLTTTAKEKNNTSYKQSFSRIKKEKLLQRTSKNLSIISRGSAESFSSKSGPESDFDLEDSGYLDSHLTSVKKSEMTAIEVPTMVRENSFRGLNYDVIGDTVCIRGESRQGLLNGLNDVSSDEKVKDHGSSENVTSSVLDGLDDAETVPTHRKTKNGLYSLGYLSHRGSFPSDLEHINSDGLTGLRHAFGRLSVGSSNQRSPRSPLLLQSSRSSSQRDLSTTSSLCSDDSTDDTIDTETSRLNTVLDYIDPNRLHSYLLRQLKSKNKATVLALSSLLPKKKFTAETMHCVRCHKEFNPKYGIKTCTLFHPERTVSKMFEDDTGADFSCDSCGTVFRAEGVFEYSPKINKTIDCGFCFVGEHTYEADEVEYQPDGIAKTCEDTGCVVFYV